MFVSFANFYWQFIKNFSQIVPLLIFMLKTSINKPIDWQARPGKDSWDSGRAKLGIAKNANLVKSKVRNSTKSKNGVKIHNKFGNLDFFTLKVKDAFIKLRQAFTKALMLTHFKPDYYI